MGEFLQLTQVVSALFGAGIALVLQSGWVRLNRVHAGQRLSMAFWEELSAVNFYDTGDGPKFAGFTSQTFDTLFREMAISIPADLSRALMQYHWRMKWLAERISLVGIPGDVFSEADMQFLREAKEENRTLLLRLKHYETRKAISVFLRPRQTISESLLKPVDK